MKMQPMVPPASSRTPPEDDPLEQAIAWKLEHDGRPSLPPRRQAAFQAWFDACADNRNAWQKLELMDSAVLHLGTPGRHALTHRHKSRTGRLATRAVMALALLCGGILALHMQHPLHALNADYASPTATPSIVALPDGSKLILDARSAVDISFTDTERRVILRAGRIYIETAKDPAQRRFSVESDHGTMIALGTRFIVDEENDATLLSVLQHAVLAQADHPGRETIIESGQTLRMADGQPFSISKTPGNADAWIDGMLVVHNAPLADVIKQFSRYRFGRLHVDPAIAQLPVTGAFSLKDTDRSLLALSSQLPIRIRRFSHFWVDILPAS